MPKKATTKKALLEEQLEEDAAVISWREREGVEPRVIYSNHVQVLVGPWDLIFRFGQVIFVNVDNKIQADELARVYMSPPHAKALVKLLARQVAVYEERFGAIADVLEEIKGASAESSPEESH